MNSVSNTGIDVSILVDGQRLTVYRNREAYWVAGEPGKPYVISVHNHHGGRIEVLQSVDGRDVLEDQVASLHNSGMIINNFWDNAGWRISDEEVRKFVFGDPAGSIAAQSGDASNVGVIGVAVFREKSRSHQPFGLGGTYRNAMGQSLFSGDIHADMADEAMVKGLAGDVARSADLGTGMGEAVSDHVGHTTFVRDSLTPYVVIQIQYRSRQWLEREGILTPDLPSAFPGSATGYGKYMK